MVEMLHEDLESLVGPENMELLKRYASEWAEKETYFTGMDRNSPEYEAFRANRIGAVYRNAFNACLDIIERNPEVNGFQFELPFDELSWKLWKQYLGDV